MFAYISGILQYKNNDYLIIEVNGIGYKINTALSTVQSIGNIGEEVRVYTHLYVREDILCIYGFLTKEELGMFELLLTVSGVGPKAAVSTLSAVSPSKFGVAIVSGDAKTLTKAQGVGNKVAQRIILELKDKISKEQLASSFHEGNKNSLNDGKNQSCEQEAVSALMVLGYSLQESGSAVSKVCSPEMDLESMIKCALKSLVR